MPSILATSMSATHAFSKTPQPYLRLIAGEGIEGDAHRGRTTQHLYLKRKDPTQPNLAQVHLFAAEMLDYLAAQGFALQPGEIGENLLTRGIDLLTLPLHTRLHIGDEAVLEVTGLRTPCLQIDRLRPGLQQHLWGPPVVPPVSGSKQKSRRCGIMSIVLTGGLVYPNDPIRLELPPAPHRPLGPV